MQLNDVQQGRKINEKRLFFVFGTYRDNLNFCAVVDVVRQYNSIAFTNKNYYNMYTIRKYILDQFQIHLKASFDAYCNRHALEKTDEQFVVFLIDHQLISATSLQKYTVLCEYKQMCDQQAPKVRKSEIVEDLSSRFCLSERTIWGILQATKAPAKKKIL